MANEITGAPDVTGQTPDVRRRDQIEPDVPEEFSIRDLSAYPDNMVADYRLDNPWPSNPRRANYAKGRSDDDMGYGS